MDADNAARIYTAAFLYAWQMLPKNFQFEESVVSVSELSISHKAELTVGIALYERQYRPQVFQREQSVPIGSPSYALDEAWQELLRSEFPAASPAFSDL